MLLVFVGLVAALSGLSYFVKDMDFQADNSD
jgi:hypothetical protein